MGVREIYGPFMRSGGLDRACVCQRIPRQLSQRGGQRWMTLLRLTTQARRVEGGHLIGRASRFSTGRAVTALKTNRYQPDPILENSTPARGTQLPGTNWFSPRSDARCSRFRAGLSIGWAETSAQISWRPKRHTRATSHLVQGRPCCIWWNEHLSPI